MTTQRPKCRVIVADDYPPDLALLVIALKTTTQFRIVHEAPTGADVVAYLKGESPFNNRRLFPMPHLLILDLKMPECDGFEVLQWVREHPELKMVSVVLTGSEDPREEARARELGADAVLKKPVGLEHIKELAARVENFMQTAPNGVTCSG